MAFTKVLITVKTYPTLSQKYTELVCTAGFLEDGSWIRIYPSPFRCLGDDQRYKKFQWVELDLEKNPADPRPESYRPRNIDDIRLGDFISTENEWRERRRIVIDEGTVHTSLDEIIRGAKENRFSLATFKPAEIFGVVAEDVPDDKDASKRQVAQQSLAQGSLFAESDTPDFKLMPLLPVKFSYRFKDDSGRESKLMIEDWEIGQLYWSCEQRHGRQRAIELVKEKYFDEFVKKRDPYLFLGTTREWHARAPNPYVIIGVFYPPRVQQLSFL